MAKALRFGSAISFLALASLTAGCATQQNRVASAGSGPKAKSELGFATRAIAALNANNVPMAIDLAEKAVAGTPGDAGFRALLGHAYFAGGRFKSAEGAYKDALSLSSTQPQVVLKLALAEIAQGKNGEALATLAAGREVLDASDYGLAVALAGRPTDAVDVLQMAARAPDADSRVRQNLALALALSGDWTNARTVAAQGVPGDQLDARIRQWMQMATPGQGSAAVAQLVGVTPAAVDRGQPVQLALNKTDTQMAQPGPVPAPAPQPQQMAEALSPVPAPVAPEPAPAPVLLAAASPVPELPFVEVANKHPKAAAKPAEARRDPAPARKAPVQTAVLNRGKSTAVVQLGSYSNSKSVLAAWNSAARRYRSLQSYAPMSARFSSPRGTFYRLSVKGFGSVNEAAALCSSVRRSGGSCFVRNVAGDTPVQFASR